MKKLIIVATCLALMPFVNGCGSGGGTTPPKDELERLQKNAADARENLKKEYKK